MTSTEAVAAELLAALDGRRLIQPFTSRDEDFDLAAGYRVGAEILRRRRARGEAPVGRKIGFTNAAIWPEYGVFAPIWAHVYDTTVVFLDEPAGAAAIGHLVQPRIEPEIVLHLASVPPATDDDEELLRHVDWIAHGFELVQCPFPGWRFQAADTVAACGLHGALVVGPRRPVGAAGHLASALRTFTITLALDGQVQARGRGANVLGGPLRALVHLLRALERDPEAEPLRAGELVTTGTLTHAPLVHGGQTWTTALRGIDLPGLSVQLRSGGAQAEPGVSES